MRINKSNITRSCRFLPFWLLMSFWQVQIIFHLLLFSFSWKLWGFFFYTRQFGLHTKFLLIWEMVSLLCSGFEQPHTESIMCEAGAKCCMEGASVVHFYKAATRHIPPCFTCPQVKAKVLPQKENILMKGLASLGEEKLSNSIINIKESVSNTNFGHMTCWKVCIII